MKNGRLFAVFAGVFLAVCLIFAVVMTALYAPSAPLKIGIIVGILTAAAIVGIVAFTVFIVLRSRSRRG